MKYVIKDLCDNLYYRNEFARTKEGNPFMFNSCKDRDLAFRFKTKEEAEAEAKNCFFHYLVEEVEQ